MRKRKTHSLIPPHLQVPVAIGGAILLLLVLVWRMGVFSREAPPPSRNAGAVQATPMAPEEFTVLAELVAQARQQMAAPPPPPEAMPPLRGNPFSPLTALLLQAEEEDDAEEVFAQGPNGDFEFEPLPLPVGPSPEEVRRRQALSEMRLSSVILNGSWAMAIVNDEYVRVGGEVAGFRVREIREREIVLEDALGRETVPLRVRERWRGLSPRPDTSRLQEELDAGQPASGAIADGREHS